LAAEIPDIENGGLSRDGKTATWKLKPNVQWHDGQPFTADDVVFNWEYASDPATAAVSIGSYKDMTVEKVDPLTVRIHFAKPTPFWANAFVGLRGMIIPKHLFEAYKGDKSRDAPANLKPVGTGPYRFVAFTPGDLVRGELNPNYHLPNRPYFDTIEMKGGGDAVSAARAVLQTGEYDYAWNLQVEDEILQRLEKGGRGRVEITPGGDIEHVQLNSTDPWTEVDGERASAKTKHPLLSDPAVRQALALLVDRQSVQDHIYGRTGVATGNFLNNPSRYRSKNTKWEFNIEKANKVLEEGGWKRGADGIRAKDGKKLSLVYQTSINAPRQKTQAIVKQACQRAGIAVELKSVTASVFFSSDVANTDTYTKFYCDLADVQHHDAVAGSRTVHESVRVLGDREQGEQVARPQRHALAQRRLRPGVSRRRDRARPGQAGRLVHSHERSGVRQSGDPGGQSAEGAGARQNVARADHQLGQRYGAFERLVPRNVSVPRPATPVAFGAPRAW